MADIALQHNIGGYVNIVTSVEPQSSAAATINGASIDRLAYQEPLLLSVLMHQQVGAVGGAPSTTSVVSTLQHSPDNSTWTAYQDPVSPAANAATAALTAANTENSLAVDVGNANRYLRISTVIAFTGGTSPTALVCAELAIAK